MFMLTNCQTSLCNEKSLIAIYSMWALNGRSVRYCFECLIMFLTILSFWFRSLMPRTLDGQITMEKTPSYFVTKEAPSRVCSMNCQAKLIVVVRDPVTRAVSDYTQTLSKNPGLPSFQSLALKNTTTGLIDTTWSAVRIGLYAKHLENWLRHFPLSHFLFVSGERLVSDPAGEMGRVQDFLGLKRVVSEKHFYFNQTKGFPCLKKPEGSSRPRCLGKSKGRPHPEIPSEVLQTLRDFYRPFNHRFYQMSGQDFGWDWSPSMKAKPGCLMLHRTAVSGRARKSPPAEFCNNGVERDTQQVDCLLGDWRRHASHTQG